MYSKSSGRQIIAELSSDGQEILLRVPLGSARTLIEEAFGIYFEDLVDVHLSRRQRQVLEAIQRNECDKDIAAALFISRRTVRYHLKVLFEKFHVHSRYELRHKMAPHTELIDPRAPATTPEP